MPSIKLASHEFVLPEVFNLRQLRDISTISMRAAPAEPDKKEEFFWNQSVDLIVVAARRCAPPPTADQIFEYETNLPELFAARKIIYEHSGLTSKDPKPGEDEAAA